jgi:hypothetical protein
MTNPKAGPNLLSPEEISKLLALTKQADTVELKLTVPDSGPGYRSTVATLEMDRGHQVQGSIRRG